MNPDEVFFIYRQSLTTISPSTKIIGTLKNENPSKVGLPKYQFFRAGYSTRDHRVGAGHQPDEWWGFIANFDLPATFHLLDFELGYKESSPPQTTIKNILGTYPLNGIQTNIPFLVNIMKKDDRDRKYNRFPNIKEGFTDDIYVIAIDYRKNENSLFGCGEKECLKCLYLADDYPLIFSDGKIDRNNPKEQADYFIPLLNHTEQILYRYTNYMGLKEWMKDLGSGVAVDNGAMQTEKLVGGKRLNVYTDNQVSKVKPKPGCVEWAKVIKSTP